MSRTNPKWLYKPGDPKHPHYLRNCDYCGTEYLARVDGESKYCGAECVGLATNPCKGWTDREGYLRCAKCGKEKPEDEFSRSAKSPTGRKPRCKECAAEDYQARKTPELMERYREQGRARREREGPGARTDYQREWRAEHREERRAWEADYHKKNPDVARLREGKRRAQKKATQAVHITDAMARTKRAYWGDQCWMCGAVDPYKANGKPLFHLDHVKPLNKGGSHMLCNLRPACPTCSLRKSQKWPFPIAAFCDPFGLNAE